MFKIYLKKVCRKHTAENMDDEIELKLNDTDS